MNDMPKLDAKYIQKVTGLLFSTMDKKEVEDVDIFRLCVIAGDLFARLPKENIKEPNPILLKTLTTLVENKNIGEIQQLLGRKKGGRRKTTAIQPRRRIKRKSLKRRYRGGAGEGEECMICYNDTALPPPFNELIPFHSGPNANDGNQNHKICRRCLLLYITKQREQGIQVVCPICRREPDIDYINGQLNNIPQESRQFLTEMQAISNAYREMEDRQQNNRNNRIIRNVRNVRNNINNRNIRAAEIIERMNEIVQDVEDIEELREEIDELNQRIRVLRNDWGEQRAINRFLARILQFNFLFLAMFFNYRDLEDWRIVVFKLLHVIILYVIISYITPIR